MWRKSYLLVLAILLIPAAGIAQHDYTRADVEDGGRLYRANCANCHGPDGDGIPGIDLGHGRFRQASSDDDLMRIIRRGIPWTPMPPTTYSEFQLRTIVAYLRSMSVDAPTTVSAGDPIRGRALFEGKGQCSTCHRVKGSGVRFGPDLSEIGALRRAAELQQSLLDPDAEVLSANRIVRVVTRDGATVTGRILNQDSFTLQLLDSKERLNSLSRTNLREVGFLPKSPMPSYRDKLTGPELSDVVSYLGCTVAPRSGSRVPMILK
jgi:cytochrome c oxidase cbb3-type subunit III